jgi:hypothetical protein
VVNHFLQVRDPIGFKRQVQHLENKLSAICSKFPEGQKSEACELLKTVKEEKSIEDKIPLINDILSKFSYQFDIMNPEIKNSKKPLVQKICLLIQSPLGTASALAACVYPICEIYDIKNQHVIFLVSFGVIFMVIYIIDNFKK